MALMAGFLLWLIVRDTLAQLGMEPYGGPAESDTCKKAAPTAITANSTVPGAALMLVISIPIGTVAAATPGHFSAFFTERGYSMEQVSLGISDFGMALVLGEVSCGTQFDRMRGRNAALLFFVIALVGCVLCCLSSGENILPMFGGLVLMGMELAPATLGLSIWAADFSTPAQYRKILQWLQISYSTGDVLLSLVHGVIYDHMGSYLLAYILFAALLCIVMTGFLAAYYSKSKEGRKNYESV